MKRPPEGGRYLAWIAVRLVDGDAFAKDLRRYEDQQLILVIGLAGGLEQTPEHRDVAEVRNLLLGLAALGLEDAAEHDRLTVVDNDGRGDGARVDRRHLLAGTTDDDLT